MMEAPLSLPSKAGTAAAQGDSARLAGSQSVAIAALSFALFGALAIVATYPSALVVMELLVFGAGLLALLYRRPDDEVSRQLPARLVWVAILAVGYMVPLYLAGDPLASCVAEGFKLFVFFGTAQLLIGLRAFPHVALVVLAAGYVGLTVGTIVMPQDHAEGMADVAKYVAPPFYVLLVALIGSYSASRLLLYIVLVPIAIFGAVLGGARASGGGIAILLALYLVCRVPTAFRLIKAQRLTLAVILCVATAVVPVVVSLTFAEEISVNDPSQSKSNIERASMITIAIDHLSRLPLVGVGNQEGFSTLLEHFETYLPGFEATTSLHNQLLDGLYFGGIIGGLLLLAQFVNLFDALLKVTTRANTQFVQLACIVAILIYMGVEPLSAKGRTSDLLAVAAAVIAARSRRQTDPNQRAFQSTCDQRSI